MEHKHIKNIVDVLNDKAANTQDATAALKWTQAALNAANSYCSLVAVRRG